MIAAWYLTTILLAATIVPSAFAWIVLRAAPQRGANRALAALLLLEGLVQGSLALMALTSPTPTLDTNTSDPRPAPTVSILLADGLRIFAITLLVACYFVFLSRLPLRATRLLRARGAALTIVALALAWVVVMERGLFAAQRAGLGYDYTPIYPLYALTGFVALGMMVAYVRSTTRGSMERAKANAFALAFGVRDITTIMGFGVWIFASVTHWDIFALYIPITGFGTIAFVLLLAYGLLRTQMFDIDLRVKTGIRRGTIVAAFALAFFAVDQGAQYVVSATYGALAGFLAAVLLVAALAPLRKLADRIAHLALPGADGSDSYLAARKRAIYQGALESAMRDGIVTNKERALLDRLRADLGIEPSDAEAMERSIPFAAAV